MPSLSCYRIRDELCEVIDTNFEVFWTCPARALAFMVRSMAGTSGPWPSWRTVSVTECPGHRSWKAGSPISIWAFRCRHRRYYWCSWVAVGGAPQLAGPSLHLPSVTGARFLLRPESVARGYGLRTALNLIYPRTSNDTVRLRGVDTKRRGPTTVRSRLQVSHQADFESFDVNRFRDVVSKATGAPADTHTWGPRVSGGDALSLQPAIGFEDIGNFCRQVEAAYRQDDYRERFDWIDYIRPVTDRCFVSSWS